MQTPFSRLSFEAQELIVDAALGKFDREKPPEIPESVKQEIIDWMLIEEKVEDCACNL